MSEDQKMLRAWTRSFRRRPTSAALQELVLKVQEQGMEEVPDSDLAAVARVVIETCLSKHLDLTSATARLLVALELPAPSVDAVVTKALGPKELNFQAPARALCSRVLLLAAFAESVADEQGGAGAGGADTAAALRSTLIALLASVRALAASGDAAATLRAASACFSLFRRFPAVLNAALGLLTPGSAGSLPLEEVLPAVATLIVPALAALGAVTLPAGAAVARSQVVAAARKLMAPRKRTAAAGAGGANAAESAAAAPAFQLDAWAAIQPAAVEAFVRAVIAGGAAAAATPTAGSAASAGPATPSAVSSAERLMPAAPPLGAADVPLCAGLLATVTQAQADASVLPALGRALRNRVEAVLPMAFQLLASLPAGAAHLGAAVVDEALTAPLLTHAVSPKDEIRAHAAGLARGIGAKLAADAVAAAASAAGAGAEAAAASALSPVGKVAAALLEVVTKKKASVPLWQSRAGVVGCLRGLAAGVAGGLQAQRDAGAAAPAIAAAAAAAGKLASPAASELSAGVLPKETHEAVRAVAFAALGEWLSLAAAGCGVGGKPALPADALSLLSKALPASPVGGGASDGVAEAVYAAACGASAAAVAADIAAAAGVAQATDAAAAAVGGIAPWAGASAAASAALAAGAPELVASLLDFVARAGSAALAAGKKGVGATVNAAFAYAALLRLSRAEADAGGSSSIAGRLSALKISADAAAAGAGAGKAGAAAPAAAAGAKKPAAAAPAAGKAAGAAKPAAGTPTGVAGSSLGALPAKVYDGWDLLATAGLANVTLLSQQLVGYTGRPAAEVAGLEGAVLAVVDALSICMSVHTEALKPYGKAYLAAIAADLRGATAGDARAEDKARVAAALAAAHGLDELVAHPSAAGAGAGSPPARAPAAPPSAKAGTAAAAAGGKAPAAGAEGGEASEAPKFKPANALFGGMLTLLTHPLPRVRLGMTAALTQLYTTPAAAPAAAGPAPHAALPLCLLHALLDRLLRAHEQSVAPSFTGDQTADASWTGVGDGPVAANAAAAALAANKGKLPLSIDDVVTPAGAAAGITSAAAATAAATGLNAVGGSAASTPAAGAGADAGKAAAGAGAAGGAAAGAPAAGVYAAVASAPVLQHALLALLGALPTAVFAAGGAAGAGDAASVLRYDAALALPAALLACCHPALTGVAGAPSRGSALAALGVAATPSSILAEEGTAGALGQADPRGRLSASLWRRALRALCGAAALAPSAERAPAPSAAADAAVTAAAAASSLRAAPPASVDVLLQEPGVGASLLAFLRGRWGVWSAVHTQRLVSARMLALIAAGAGWVAPALMAGQGSGTGAGGRPFVTEVALPLLLQACHEGFEAAEAFTSVDVAVWRTPEGVACTAGERSKDEGLWQAELAASGHGGAKAQQRAPRMGRRGHRMREAQEEAWAAEIRAELAAKRTQQAAEDASAAALAAARAKGAGGGKGFSSLSEAPAKPSAAGAKGGKPGAAGDVDPAALKLAEQSAIRRHLQAVYSSLMGALSAVRAVFSAAPHAMQALVPYALPSLLPCLGLAPVGAYAAIAVRAALEAALCNTVAAPTSVQAAEAAAAARATAFGRAPAAAAAPLAPSGASFPSHVVGDWVRALAVIQGDPHPAHHGAGASAAGAAAPGADLGASASSRGAAPDGGSDACGLTGMHLAPFTALFKRVLLPLSLRVMPASPFGGTAFTAGSSGSASDAADAAAAGGSRPVRTGLLPPSAFALLFPILRAIVTASVPLGVMHGALAVLAAHVVLPPEVRAAVSPAFAQGGEAGRDEGASGAAAASGPLLQLTPSAYVSVALDSTLADGSGSIVGAAAAAAASGSAGSASSALDGAAALAEHGEHYRAPPGFLTGGAAVATASGVRPVGRALAAHAAVQAAAYAADPAAAAASGEVGSGWGAASAPAAAFYGCGGADAEYLCLRSLREGLVFTLLHALRVAPRSSPAPDAVLLALVRGAHVDPEEYAAAAAAGGAGSEGGAGRKGGKGKRRSSDADEDEEAHAGAGEEDEEGEGEEEEEEDDASAHLALGGSRLHTLALGETAPLLGGSGLLSPNTHVRAACMSALDIVLTLHLSSRGLAAPAAAAAPGGEAVASGSLPRTLGLLQSRLWLAVHDVDEDVAAHADMLWARCGCELDCDAYAPPLLALLAHPAEPVRVAAGAAVAAGIARCAGSADATIKGVQAVYMTYAEGLARSIPSAWKPRAGALACLGSAAERKAIPVPALLSVLPFLIQHGLAEDSAPVRAAALAAGRALIDGYGASHIKLLLPVLEAFLSAGAASPLSAASEAARDAQREGAVVLLGACAKYLAASDPKVLSILSVLLDTLNTPSEAVQRSVSQTMAPLCKMLKESPAAGSTVETLMERCLRHRDFAVRRGAAFGLGGAIKGFGLSALKAYNVMATLEAAAGDAKDANARQGALFAFECMCESLGMLFEPYVTRILPHLLRCFGDGDASVRDAAAYAAKAVMSILTGHGVKLVLPAVLNALSEPAWRSKQAAIAMLGNMAFCAPKQLGQCLPQVVPKLVSSFDDPHPKVQASAREALQDIGKVIKNPEISAIAPKLLAALADPADCTKGALDALANTDFVHAIDPASLALIVPILRRGLADRTTSIKVATGVIVGNMCSLIADAKDIVPYLGALMAALKKTVVDAIPDVRAVSAKAVGSLVKDVGEDEVPDLLPWLIETMQSDGSTVERSGAAQALAELLTAQGEPKLSDVVTRLLPLAAAPKAGAREGLLWLVVFLPATMGQSFSSLIATLFPVVLQALADDVEGVRDVAVRAGQNIVKAHARSDASYLLPPLEAGLFSPSWRIRQAAVQLVGDLIIQVSGGGHYKAVTVAGNTEAYPGAADDGEEEEEVEDAFASEDEEEGLSGGEASDSESEEEAAGAGAGAAKGAKGGKGGKEGALEAAAAKAAAAARRKAGGASAPGAGAAAGPGEISSAKAKKSKGGDDEGMRSNKRSERRAADSALGKRARGEAAKSGGGKGGKGGDAEAAGGRAGGRGGPAGLDETFSVAAMDGLSAAVVRALGMEARNRVMAGLYMVRCDMSAVVRQVALKVWKDTVQNTPRTLREILPALMRAVIAALAAEGDAGGERRVVAGRCLGEVVRKLGDRVLPEIVPILQRGLASELASTRCGVCLGLAEVIEAASRRQIESHLAALIPAIRDALCDETPAVRDAAARAFNTLQKVVGHDAVGQVIPSLVAAVDAAGEDEEAMQRALSGLKGVVAMRSREVLPFLLPQLLAAPLTLAHARALAGVASVASGTLHHHLSAVVPAIVACLAGQEALPGRAAGGKGKGSGGAAGGASAAAAAQLQTDSSPEAVAARLAGPLGAALGTVAAQVESGAGVAWALEGLLKQLNDEDDAVRRRVGAWLIQAFVTHTEADVSGQVPLLLRELLHRFTDTDEHALKAAWEALFAIVNNGAKVPAESLADHVEFTRNVLSGMVSDARFRKGGVGASSSYYIPGLCLPKGLDALLPIYQRALMHGSVEQREVAAAGLGELVEHTTHDALKAFYVKITGPLIRIVADKFPWQVKAAILRTLIAILDKGGVALKPFQPQLQATFAKALADPTQLVRSLGAKALGKLMPLAMRADPLINELCAGIGSSTGGILESMLQALAIVMFRGGEKVTPPVRTKAIELCLAPALLGSEEEEAVRRLAASAAAACVRHADAATAESVVTRLCLTRAEVSVGGSGAALVTVDPVKDARAAGVAALLKYAPAALLPLLGSHVLPSLAAAAKDDASAIRQHAAKGVGYALASSGREQAVAPAAAGAGAGAGAAAPAAAAAAAGGLPGSDKAPEPADLTPEVTAAYAKEAVPALLPVLLALIGDADSDVRKRGIDAAKRWARYSPRSFLPHASTLVPLLVAFVTKEGGNMVLRSAAERALLHATGARHISAPTAAPAGPSGAGMFAAVSGAVDGSTSRFLGEYGRRVLAKMDADSDDDEDDAE